MHNAVTQSKKINQTLAMFQGYGLARYRKCKTDYSSGARFPNLLIIAHCGLASFCLNLCPFCLCLGDPTLAPSILASCVYMQRQEKQAIRQVKKQTKEIGRACEEHTTKESQTGENKAC